MPCSPTVVTTARAMTGRKTLIGRVAVATADVGARPRPDRMRWVVAQHRHARAKLRPTKADHVLAI